MKKYIIVPFCCISLLNGMITQQPNNKITQQPISAAHEWNAEDYAKGNKIQEETAKQLLSTKGILLTNKIIFDIGSGAGNISAFMAQQGASWVLGIDASSNMISWSRSHYGHIRNLLFKQSLAENFSPSIQCNLVTLFYSLHWIKNENKKLVLQKCYDCLLPGGELIGNIRTVEDGLPASLKILQEILPQLQTIAPTLKKENIVQSSGSGSSYLTHTQLYTILKEIGFAQIFLETKSLNFTFKDINALSAFERPVMMNRPFMQSLDSNTREEIFKLYVHELFKTLKYVEDKNKDGDDYYYGGDDYYIAPEARTTVIHCFKGTASKL
jgi:trans-aconitate methyltransferase